ncbi:hypothetical protein JW921_03570 [Candidatus Fermentibacterales bacterium]|nr:hypothetical protein [Candidatus Fermentibacterales bacterium]
MNLDLFSASPAAVTRVLYLDTETTGIESFSEVCEIGLILATYEGTDLASGVHPRSFSALLRPAEPIPPEASAVHHITNEMVASSPALAEIVPELEPIVAGADMIAGHNLRFDLDILLRQVPELFGRFGEDAMLDTLRLARHVWPDLPSYALQALRYRFALDALLQMDGSAHRALFDAALVRALLEQIAGTDLTDCKTLRELGELARSPIEILTFEFGKYKGQLLEDIMVSDPDYVRWLLDQSWAKKEHPDLYHTLTRKSGRRDSARARKQGRDRKGDR